MEQLFRWLFGKLDLSTVILDWRVNFLGLNLGIIDLLFVFFVACVLTYFFRVKKKRKGWFNWFIPTLVLLCGTVVFYDSSIVRMVAIILWIVLILIYCREIKKDFWKWTTFQYFLVVIGSFTLFFSIGFLTKNWSYVIPVTIALIGLFLPSIAENKRRRDNQQDAFDSFYFSVYSLPRIVAKAIGYIDDNLNSEPDTSIRLTIDPLLNANFINHINHTDLNRFFREQGMLNELRELSSSLSEIDNVNDYYSKRLSEHNITIREQEKVWNNWQTLTGKIWFEIACAKSTMQDASKESMDFFDDYREWVVEVISIQPIVRKRVADSLKDLCELTHEQRGDYFNILSPNDSDEFIAMKANEINDQANLFLQAYDTMDYEKQRMLDRLSAQREILEVAKKRFEDFIENNKPLISKELKKQLDEMEKAQTSK